jgi:hypothetical protein
MRTKHLLLNQAVFLLCALVGSAVSAQGRER